MAISTLSASAGGTKLNPDAEQIKALEDAGITDEQLKNLGIADIYMASQNQKQENSSYWLTEEEKAALRKDAQDAMAWARAHRK